MTIKFTSRVLFILFTLLLLLAIYNNRQAQQTFLNESSKTIVKQSDILLATFLLTEQAGARKQLLDQIKEQEHLKSIEVVIDKNYKFCGEIKLSKPCIEYFTSLTFISFPIYAGDVNYGYLRKEIETRSAISTLKFDGTYWLILVLVIILTALSIIGITNFTTNVLPKETGLLLKWVEEVATTSKTPSLRYFQFEEFNQLSKKMEQIIIAANQAREAAAIAEVAARVSHDIRSPLAALRLVEDNLSALPDDTRKLLQTSIARIREIADEFLSVRKKFDLNDIKIIESAENKYSHLFLELDAVALEKGMTANEVKFLFDPKFVSRCYSLFVPVPPRELKSIFSNFIQNSVEALSTEIIFSASLEKMDSFVSITITDNGTGMPDNVLEKLGNSEVTHGKASGVGIGFLNSSNLIKKYEGTLKVNSRVGRGTKVSLGFNLNARPEWLLGVLEIKDDSILIVVDDDPSIHQLWLKIITERNISKKNPIELICFLSPEEVPLFLKSQNALKDSFIFLYDYSFSKHEGSGIDYILEAKILAKSYLVTSMYLDLKVQSRCNELGLRVVPKALLWHLPIAISRSEIL